MRRVVLILVSAALSAGGLLCVLAALSQAVGLPLLGALLLLLGFVGAIASALQSRGDLDTLAARLTERAKTGQPRRLTARSQDVGRITSAVNDLLEQSDRRVTDSQMKAKELEIQLKVATAERQHAEAIIYSISDAVLVTDPFDELVLANESAARALEFDLQTSERAPVEHVLHDEKIISFIREMRQSRSASGRRIIEHTIKSPIGDRTYKITLSCVAGAKREGAEGSAGVVAVLHDMTKEKEVAEMKNDFVSNVSHELRTPLASIKAYVEMLIDGEADDEKTQNEFYEVIQNEANRLSRLIDNILNISRIESGLVKVNKQPQSLTVIMKEALEVIVPQARGKNISIKEELTPVFYQTLADRDMLYQALLNLLSNAIKYTPEGGMVTATTLVDETNKRVLVKITDTGVGIPPKDLPFVFDKFYRAEANNRMAKGTGLGLSLVKHIIENVHQGRILLESTAGKGSTFGFELALTE